jgi:outer membrane protein assembly factor BamA
MEIEMTKRNGQRAGAILLSLVAAATGADTGAAQETQGSALTAGLGWSSVHGTVASVGLEAMNIRDSGFDASVQYRRGDTGVGGVVKLGYGKELGETQFGADTKADVRLTWSGSDWKDQAFSSEVTKLGFGLSAKSPEQAISYRAGVFFQQDHHFGAKAAASPLVLAALGASTAAGVVVDVGTGSLSRDDLIGRGYRVDGSVTASLLGDRHFAAFDLRSSMGLPLGSSGVLVLRAEGGVIQGLDGQDVSLHDRAFMGGTAPRGFAVGGAGPRDFVAGSIDSPLGGNRYVFGSVEARREVTKTLTLGLFVDVGAAWSLDQTGGGAMGVIDDALHPRGSVGLSAYWATGLGKVRLSVANAIEHRDNDRLNPISLDLLSQF